MQTELGEFLGGILGILVNGIDQSNTATTINAPQPTTSITTTTTSTKGT